MLDVFALFCTIRYTCCLLETLPVSEELHLYNFKLPVIITYIIIQSSIINNFASLNIF